MIAIDEAVIDKGSIARVRSHPDAERTAMDLWVICSENKSTDNTSGLIACHRYERIREES